MSTMKPLAALLALSLSAGASLAQSPPAILDDQTIPLALAFPETPAAAGYKFRSRKIELAPGSRTEEISHAGRPSITYVIRGVVTEHRTGSAQPLTHSVGAATMDRGTVTHYWENTGSEPAILLVVGLAATDGD